MEAKLMKVRCDYCRGRLGLLVHRYWHMRFCSSACAQDYERQRDETKQKFAGWMTAPATMPRRSTAC